MLAREMWSYASTLSMLRDVVRASGSVAARAARARDLAPPGPQGILERRASSWENSSILLGERAGHQPAKRVAHDQASHNKSALASRRFSAVHLDEPPLRPRRTLHRNRCELAGAPARAGRPAGGPATPLSPREDGGRLQRWRATGQARGRRPPPPWRHLVGRGMASRRAALPAWRAPRVERTFLHAVPSAELEFRCARPAANAFFGAPRVEPGGDCIV